MRQTDILSQPPRLLDQRDRLFFFEQGYLVVEQVIQQDWLHRLRAAMNKLVDRSRSLEGSNGTFDLEPGHSAEQPRLRRIAYLDDLDPVFWEFCSSSILADLAVDLLGPDVRFRECMLNLKWAHGGQEVKWHQDIPFYPHTNLSPAQFLVFLDDVGPEQGPLCVVPGSHKGTIFDHYDGSGNWLGHIPDERLGEAQVERAAELCGPAGSVEIHHCATVHGSKPNRSAQGRPMLITGYASCDSMPYTAPAYASSHYGAVVRGEEARYARHDPVEMRLPPDWSKGYTSIFEHQERVKVG